MRSIRATWDRGDYSSTGWAHPEIEFVVAEDDPDASLRRGHDAIARRLAEIDELAEFRVEPTEFIDRGDFVVFPVRVINRGRDSGASFEQQEVHSFKLRDGKIIEVREYREEDEALTAGRLARFAEAIDEVSQVLTARFDALAALGV